jgi:hypothetical protein
MVDTIKLNYKGLRNLELVAFYELPENRRNLEIVLGEEMRFFYDSIDKIELALMDPRRMDEVEQLSSQEVMHLFMAWVMASNLEHKIKWKQLRKKERRMSSLFTKVTDWLGLTQPKPVKLPELPKVKPAESKKPSPKVAPARATATAKKAVTKKKGTK